MSRSTCRHSLSVTVFFGVAAFVDIAAAQQLVDFAVGDDEFVQGFCPGHRLFHEAGILHPFAVVGKGADIGRHGFEICDLPALLSDGYAAVGLYGDRRRLFDDLQLLFEVGQAVGHGL